MKKKLVVVLAAGLLLVGGYFGLRWAYGNYELPPSVKQFCESLGFESSSKAPDRACGGERCISLADVKREDDVLIIAFDVTDREGHVQVGEDLDLPEIMVGLFDSDGEFLIANSFPSPVVYQGNDIPGKQDLYAARWAVPLGLNQMQRKLKRGETLSVEIIAKSWNMNHSWDFRSP